MPDEVQRVLMTADTVGGVFTYALTLSRELSRLGIEVHLVTMGAPMRREQREATEAIANLVVHETTFRLEWEDDPWDDVGQAVALLRTIEREVSPNVIHVNGYAYAAGRFSVPVVVGAHSCVLSWYAAARRERAPATYDRYRRAVRAGLSAADAVIAPTRAMLGALAVHHGPVEDGHVIPNGAELPRVESGAKDPLVLAAGRIWDPAKNADALLRVAPKLPWRVAVAGWGEGAPPRENVDMLGWLGPSALGRWMARAGIFVLPARYEPFGLCPLEAGLRSCALVLGDIASLREVWGDAALYVDPDDDDALRDTIVRLAEDEHLRATMAARARHRAGRYDAARMARRTLSLYRSLCSRKEISSCA